MKNILIIITFSILISGCGGGKPNKVENKEANNFIPAPESILNSTPENIAPTITGTPKRYLLANTDYSFTPDALDLDGDDLTFAIENKPNWAIFNNASGELTGTPITANEYRNIKISVSDNVELTSLPTFNITVQAPPNNAPTISGAAPTLIETDIEYQFIPTATDLDNDDLIFTIENKPSWGTFSNVSGKLKGTPVEANEYKGIIISVSDGIESTSLPAFNITVQAPLNKAPTISGAAPTLIETDSEYLFIPLATDVDGDDLTFAIANKPTWTTFSNVTGELKGTPIAANEYRGIRISVSDGTESTSLPVFNITVQSPPNNAPTISGAAPTLIETDSEYLFTPLATDLDGDDLTFTIANKPTWTTFSNVTGELKGTPKAANEYRGIRISVSDGIESASLPVFTITAQAPPNNSPSISGAAPTLIETDTEYQFIPTATDLDNDDLTFIIENKPTWATFSNVTGELKGTPVAANEYRGIRISVSDGIESASLPVFAITVQAPPNNAPTISGAAPTLIETDTEYQFIPTATDLDNDDLIFTIENKPSWASFSNVSGKLKGTPVEANEYKGIIISVSDDIESTSLPAFNITVQTPEPEPNNAPTISGTAATVINTDSDYQFIPTATDLDNDDLTFSIENKPSWATFSNVTGELKGTPIAANEYRGITISVSDGIESASLPVFDIHVLNKLHNVSITWEAPTTDVNGDDIKNLIGYKIMYGKESGEYEHTLSINDPNVTSARISDLERQNHYFSMKAITLHGLESESAIEYVYFYLN